MSEEITQQTENNPMLTPRIEKVVVNLNVGKSGEALEKAFKVLYEITGQKPVKKNAKESIRDFGIRKGEPIACVVTLRRQAAIDFLKKILPVVENKISKRSFDDRGNFAFGLKEHIEIPGVKYDPDVGIFGMDVCVTINRPGDRVHDRRKKKTSIGKKHVLNTDESIAFVKQLFTVEIV